MTKVETLDRRQSKSKRDPSTPGSVSLETRSHLPAVLGCSRPAAAVELPDQGMTVYTILTLLILFDETSTGTACAKSDRHKHPDPLTIESLHVLGLLRVTGLIFLFSPLTPLTTRKHKKSEAPRPSASIQQQWTENALPHSPEKHRPVDSGLTTPNIVETRTWTSKTSPLPKGR